MELEKGSNLDTGEFTLTGTVSCKTGEDVDIRGKINGTLTVNSTTGKITNYSIVENVVIKNTASTSYHERGQVKTFTIDNTLTGKVVFENDAYVETLKQNNTTGNVVNNGYIKTVEGSAQEEDKVKNPVNYALDIRTFEELCNFRDKVNAGTTYAGMTVRLMADIDISSRAWTPIGAASRNNLDNQPVFRGIFDGNNKTISGLTNTGFRIFPIYAASNTTTPKDYKEYVFGLFGSVINAEIKNLNMAKVNIDLVCDNVNKVLGDSVGAIAGFAGGDSCMITNCHVLSGKINGFVATAGIIGRVHTKTAKGAPGKTVISNCSNAATVTSSRRAAGILGFTNIIQNGVSIKNCENKASVTCMSNDGEFGIQTETANYYQAAGIANSNDVTSIDQNKFVDNKNDGNVTLSNAGLSGACASKVFYFPRWKI